MISLLRIGVAALVGAWVAIAGRRRWSTSHRQTGYKSSCPPAEAYLPELANREDISSLEFHVDYWDYISLKDRFAEKAFTNRQQG